MTTAFQHVVGGNSNDNNNIQSSFGLVNKCEIIVPIGYKHLTQLNTLNPEDFYYFSNHINDRNFVKTTHNLHPGKKYVIDLYEILKSTSYEDCLIFLKMCNSIFVSSQGLSLLWQLNREILPVDMVTISMDIFHNLSTFANGKPGIPNIYCHPDHKTWDFGFSCFEIAFQAKLGRCLMCVSENA